MFLWCAGFKKNQRMSKPEFDTDVRNCDVFSSFIEHLATAPLLEDGVTPIDRQKSYGHMQMRVPCLCTASLFENHNPDEDWSASVGEQRLKEATHLR